MKDDKPLKLKAFLSALPESIVRQLTAAVEMDRVSGGKDLPHGMLLDGLRPTLSNADSQIFRTPTPMRLFCMPFEDLLIAGERKEKRAGRIARSSLTPVWNWLASDLLPTLYTDHCVRLSDAILANDQPLMRQITREIHAAGAAAIMRAIEGAPDGSEKRKAIVKILGHEDVVQDAIDMCYVLEAAPEVLDLREVFEMPVTELTPDLLEQLRAHYEMMAKHMPDSARYLLVVVMCRLDKPWEILRSGAMLSRRLDDTLLSRTDLGLLGELLFGDLEDEADYFQSLDVKTFDPDDALFHLVRFSRLSHGITNELGILRDGPWGQRLMTARKRASSALEDLIERIPGQIRVSMPIKNFGSAAARKNGRPDLAKEPEPEVLDRGIQLATFMRESRPISGNAACSAVHADSYDSILDALNNYRSGLLSELRSCDDKDMLSRARAYLDLTVELTAILVSEGEAQIFRRKGVLAERNDTAATG